METKIKNNLELMDNIKEHFDGTIVKYKSGKIGIGQNYGENKYVRGFFRDGKTVVSIWYDSSKAEESTYCYNKA